MTATMRQANAPGGKTLIIANPQAHSGKAGEVAERLKRFLGLYHHSASSYELVYTERPHHAEELARRAHGYAAVLALGGDGVIHEVANGLMAHDAATRPALGLIPVGSGNDYARTLGIDLTIRDDFAHLLRWKPTRMDVGRIQVFDHPVVDVCDPGNLLHTEYFVETFSFGLDAAIALGTQELRTTTPLTGDALYVASGLTVFGRNYRAYPARISWDGCAARTLEPYLMAVQLGPTYGSGFKVCPDADPTDGRFDVCYATAPLPRAITLPLFLRARTGNHVSSRHIHLLQMERLRLDLAEDTYPLQADGERVRAQHMTVEVLPAALTVLRPAAPQVTS